MRAPGKSPRESESEPFFGGLSRAEAMAAVPNAPDWEALMEEGVLPSLLLGDERRLRRETRPSTSKS